VWGGTNQVVTTFPFALRTWLATRDRVSPGLSQTRAIRVFSGEGFAVSGMEASSKIALKRLHGQCLLQCICNDSKRGAVLMPCSRGEVSRSMHVLSPVVGAVALVLVSGPAMALDTWTVGVERGLPTYALASDVGAFRLVCDPDRVFGPTPNGAVVVRFAKDPDPTMIVVLAKTGEQARLPVTHGTVAQAAVEAADWARMIGILRAGGSFAVVTSTDSLAYETAPLPALACE
jgi:hypothetical protein